VKKPSIKKENLKKGIYIIPSLFTCGNMALGVLSIFASSEGLFLRAAWFLVGALVCDILDGRIARMTKTTSEFGLHIDSLSDVISFGVAPAFMMHQLVLADMGPPGVAIAVLFVLCSALRLARFNVLAQSGESYKHFVGLPTPASAGVILSFVLSYEILGPAGYGVGSNTIPGVAALMPVIFRAMPVVTIILSFLMVSNVPYVSFKKTKLTRVRSIQLFCFFIVLAILLLVFPQNVIFIIFFGYAASGLLFYFPRLLWAKKRNRKKREPVKSLPEA